MLITRIVDQIAAFKALIFSKLKCYNLSPILHYLGIRVRRDRTRYAFKVLIETYINKLAVNLNRVKAAARATLIDIAILKLKLYLKDNRAPKQLL
jgi:hypothetical protein